MAARSPAPPPRTQAGLGASQHFHPQDLRLRTPSLSALRTRIPESQPLRHHDPGLCTLCPLHTLGFHSQLDARPLTLDVHLRPPAPLLGAERYLTSPPPSYLGDSVVLTAGPQGPGLGAAPASLLSRGAAAGSPILDRVPPRDFKRRFWPRPVLRRAPPTSPGVPAVRSGESGV